MGIAMMIEDDDDCGYCDENDREPLAGNDSFLSLLRSQQDILKSFDGKNNHSNNNLESDKLNGASLSTMTTMTKDSSACCDTYSPTSVMDPSQALIGMTSDDCDPLPF